MNLLDSLFHEAVHLKSKCKFWWRSHANLASKQRVKPLPHIRVHHHHLVRDIVLTNFSSALWIQLFEANNFLDYHFYAFCCVVNVATHGSCAIHDKS
ncbi:hypothetical protein BpHYR1_011499 [Brachionus plicatilis]|uniref:Uncharacterized protein n=1 Tax=Brachionus plicatilis TaxID=10195 RepID=A0A3M7S4W1_BRAPC|nr:hypothetical protein BpHYR1_011499 [Brachionus plicatilis]